VTVEFVYRLIDVIIYPFGWVGSAIIITLLLEMRDKRRVSDA
jgi:hypothetical protein